MGPMQNTSVAVTNPSTDREVSVVPAGRPRLNVERAHSPNCSMRCSRRHQAPSIVPMTSASNTMTTPACPTARGTDASRSEGIDRPPMVTTTSPSTGVTASRTREGRCSPNKVPTAAPTTMHRALMTVPAPRKSCAGITQVFHHQWHPGAMWGPRGALDVPADVAEGLVCAPIGWRRVAND